MKTFILKISTAACILGLFAVASISSSCNKDKTCHGTVKVVDSNGVGIGNATVKLAAPSVNGDVVYENVTDGSGDASFEVKLPAIFDVTATKASYPGTGVGVLRLDEPGKSAEVTVKIQ
ncbi:MAG TPA: carboxypeptidase-like regulatory domain-containing protein [Bacteroidia bacterium]|jgi:hypothetical protein